MPPKKDVTFGKSHDLSVILEPAILKSSPKFGNYRTPVEGQLPRTRTTWDDLSVVDQRSLVSNPGLANWLKPAELHPVSCNMNEFNMYRTYTLWRGQHRVYFTEDNITADRISAVFRVSSVFLSYLHCQSISLNVAGLR